MKLKVAIISFIFGLVAIDADEKLSAEQLRAVFVVSGDNSSGTAFLTEFKGGKYVLTNQHVLDGQSEVTMTNSLGEKLRGSKFIAATDLDLVMIGVSKLPEGLESLPLAEKVAELVEIGDEVLVPGNSKGGGVITVTPGKVVAVGPKRIEIDAPVFQGNSGGPIIHVGSGKVIAVLTEAEIVHVDEFTELSIKNKKSQIKRSIRYFGHRVDSVEKWELMNWEEFNETSSLLARGSRELEAIFKFMANDSNQWKDFSELHAAYNAAMEIVEARTYSDSAKADARKKLVRQLDSLVRAPLARVEKRKIYYIHQRQMDNLGVLSDALLGGVEIVRKDVALFNELLQRDGN